MDNQNWELCMRDIDRIRIIRNVLDKRLTNKQAAKQLDLSKRQVIRLKHRYRRQGVAGLIHGLRGQVSNNQLKPRLGDEILQRLRQASWEGFGPTFAHEQLMKKGLRVGVATVRTIMIKNGLWKAHKPSERHRAEDRETKKIRNSDAEHVIRRHEKVIQRKKREGRCQNARSEASIPGAQDHGSLKEIK